MRWQPIQTLIRVLVFALLALTANHTIHKKERTTCKNSGGRRPRMALRDKPEQELFGFMAQTHDSAGFCMR
jgi:hypothetical protein